MKTLQFLLAGCFVRGARVGFLIFGTTHHGGRKIDKNCSDDADGAWNSSETEWLRVAIESQKIFALDPLAKTNVTVDVFLSVEACTAGFDATVLGTAVPK